MFSLNLTTAKVIRTSDQHIVRTTETDARFAFILKFYAEALFANTAGVVSRLTVSSKKSGEPTRVRPRRGGGPHGSFHRGSPHLVFSASDCPRVWFQLNGRIRLSQSRGRSTGEECASGEPERDFSFGGESGSGANGAQSRAAAAACPCV